MSVGVVAGSPVYPPMNPGDPARGGLLAVHGGQYVLPYRYGAEVGDLVVCYIPNTCPTGMYGDPFVKLNLTDSYTSLHYRHLDGTEGTYSQWGYPPARGLLSTLNESGRTFEQVMASVTIRGVDMSVAPTVRPSVGGQYVRQDGARWIVEARTPGFTLSSPSYVISATVFAALNWDSGDPDYIPYFADGRWNGSPNLGLVTQGTNTGDGVAGMRLACSHFPAGPVPDIVSEISVNYPAMIQSGIALGGSRMIQVTVVFASGLTATTGTPSNGTVILAGSRVPGSTITVTRR